MSSLRSFTDAFGITSSSAAAAAAEPAERTPVPTAWPRAPVGAKPGDPETPASLVAMIVDRSGSMSSMGSEVAGGCNSFLDEQRKGDADTGIPSHLIFSTFDDKYDTVRNARLADQPPISPEEIKPRGMTALYDAIGRCLDEATAANNARTIPFEKVIVFILTDGHENSSKRYTKADITQRIQRLETEYKWEFYFAAANQNAMETGTALGCKATQCVTFDAATDGACAAAFRATSSKVNAVRGGDLASAGYSAAERESCLTGAAPAPSQ